MSDGLDRKTIEPGNSCGGYSVYGHGTYQRSSVLAGRPKRVFLTISELSKKHKLLIRMLR